MWLKKLGLLAILLFLVSSCEEAHQQKANEIFEQNYFPQELENIANPKLKTIIKNQDNGILRVAVIDSGVDYLHPQLIPQIHFSKEDDDIVGAGRDVLGDDNWAHPNLINASLFSFAAQEIRDGKIIGPQDSPLKVISDFNQKFMEQLQNRLLTDEIIQKSLFKKINDSNFSIFGATYLSLKDTSKFKNNDKDLIMDSDKNILSNELENKCGKGILRSLINLKWDMGATIGVPKLCDLEDESKFLELWSYIYGAEQFVKIIKEEYQNFLTKEKFQEALDTYWVFIEARQKTQDIDKEKLKITALGSLQNVIIYQKNKVKLIDPLFSVAKKLCGLIDDKSFSLLTNLQVHKDQKNKIVDDKIDFMFKAIEQVNKEIVENSLTNDDEKIDAKRNITKIDEMKKLIKEHIKSRGYEIFYCQNEVSFELKKQYETWANLVKHPYIDSQSNDASHGTHVAGIIASQHSKIEIVPIRVLTASMKQTKQTINRVQEFYKNYFKTWIQNPVISKGIQLKIQEIDPSYFSSNDQAVIADEILNYLLKYFHETYNQLSLSHTFFLDIVEAIRYVGQHNIKIANLSLGVDFGKMTTPIDDKNSTKKLSDLFTFFVFELYKYRTAEIIKEYAPGTIFVVAAGNDGSWIDSKAKTILPCDLSSPFYDQVYKQMTGVQPIPNNTLENMICVGSIDQADDLSSYTNLALSRKLPFVLSRGESIYSAIKTTDCAGVNQQFAEQYGDDLKTTTISESKETGKAVLEKLSLLDPFSNQNNLSLRKEMVGVVNFYTNDLFSKLLLSAKTSSCINSNNIAAKLSGTSMASPAVAGFFARYMIEKMSDFNLEEDEIYNLNLFSPQKIISEVMDQSPEFGGDSRISDVPKITDLKNYDDRVFLENQKLAKVMKQFYFAAKGKLKNTRWLMLQKK